MNYEQIQKELKAKIYKPVYFLSGEEPFYIDQISNQIEEHLLDEADKAFNQSVLYGKDVDVPTIIIAARRYPMMAPFQVIIVKEAQNIRNIETLATYIENPMPTTVLVICYKYKTLDKRKSLAKKLVKQKQVLFESKKLYENQIPAWINQQLKEKGYSIEPKATMMLADFLGTDLGKINNELQKLQLVVAKETPITSTHVQENIGISKDYNNFELQSALGKKDEIKAFKIARYFEENPQNNPMVVTLSVLFNFFSKLFHFHFLPNNKNDNAVATRLAIHPFFVKDYRLAAQKYTPRQLTQIIEQLREYDMKSKGVGNLSSSHGQLLNELVYKILNN